MVLSPDILELRDLLKKHEFIKELRTTIDSFAHPNWETRSKKNLQIFLDAALLDNLTEMQAFAKKCAPKS